MKWGDFLMDFRCPASSASPKVLAGIARRKAELVGRVGKEGL